MDFEEYVRAHEASLLRLAFLLTRDAVLAQDLVQTALIHVLRRWGQVSRVEHPDAYVRKVLLNSHLAWRRQRSNSELPVSKLWEPVGVVPHDFARSSPNAMPCGVPWAYCPHGPGRSSSYGTTAITTTPALLTCWA